MDDKIVETSYLSKLYNKEQLPPNLQIPRSVLESYFGKEIFVFESILPDEAQKNKATSILEGFFSLAFDSGLRREISFRYQEKEYKEKPVYLLSRSAWINQIEQRTGKNFQGLQGVIMLDIAGLNNANKVTEDVSTGGDFLLQITARLLNEALDEINPNLRNSFDFIPCRYGGDEFAVAVIKKDKNFSQDINLGEILEGIKAKISSEKAFYNRDGEIKEESIALKDKETKALSLPADEVDKLIFINALSSGIVLDTNDIEIIKMIFTEKGKVNQQALEDYFRRYQIQEPDYETEALFIMHDLVNKHPELSLPLYLANRLDSKDEEINGKNPGFRKNKRLISLLRFIKRSLGDRLLSGGDVLTFADFQKHLKRRDFVQVLGIEMKFIKEFNDHFSMVVADDVIRQLFNQLKNCLDENDLKQLFLYRRGGSFFIGIRPGVNLRNDFLENLQKLVSNFKVETILAHRLTIPLKIPLGLAIWDSPSINKLKEFMENLDRDWYSKVPEEIRNKIKREEKIQLPEKPDTLDGLLRQLTLENLYHLFFSSNKRGKERRAELLTLQS